MTCPALCPALRYVLPCTMSCLCPRPASAPVLTCAMTCLQQVPHILCLVLPDLEFLRCSSSRGDHLW